MATLNRRDFLRGVGVAGAATAAGCAYDPVTPVEHVLPYVRQPEDQLPGEANYFSTACGECAAACGLVARSKEGRVVMVEGNPDHPMGPALCTRGHMTLLHTYSPDRVSAPMEGGKALSWDDAMARVVGAIKEAQAAGKQVAWLGQYRTGSVARLLETLSGGAGLRRVHWEALGLETIRTAALKTFGVAAIPTYDLARAHVVLSFGLDFLGTAYGMLGMAKGWAEGKDPSKGGFVTRFVAVEPRVSITSAQADHFLPPTPGTEAQVAFAIAKLASEKSGYAGPAAGLLSGVDVAAAAAASGISEEKLKEVAEWMATHDSVALPGGHANAGTDATALAVGAFLINEVCGNIGKTVRFGAELTPGQVNSYAEAKALLEDVRSGKVGVLILEGANPVYNFPASDKVGEALDAAGLLVHIANEADDSSRAKTLLLPPGSPLEQWGDAEFVKGVHTLMQPAMTRLHDTKSVGDILLALAKALVPPAPVAAPVDGAAPDAMATPASLGTDHADFAAYLQARWAREIAPATESFDAFWVKARQVGGYFLPSDGTAAAVTLTALPATSGALPGSDKALVIFPSPNLGDGRHANRAWAQELPDALSTNAWTSWVELHPKVVTQLGLAVGDKVKVQTDAGEVTLGFFASPGVREDTIGLVLGNGHEGMGRYARGRGVNPMKLVNSAVDADSGALATFTTRARVTRVGPGADTFELVGNLDQDGRPIANVVSAVDAVSHLEGEPGSIVKLHQLPWDERLEREGIHDMYPEPQHPTYRFAMAIDTNVCTGCAACIVACNLENNIPFVGPDQTRKGRGMSWIRMDRFWEGEGENQDVRFMPVMCQQCAHAPCEGVCPVLATYHNLDGLNAMIYNRCVGTRYCANNCPYTARRFNYHTFTWPESMHLMLNPDVSVREMGVMEKCTFCVQRIRSVKDSWRDVKEVVPDRALQRLTACAAACPTGAITFGNAKDQEGKVAEKFRTPRTYTMLGELNTKPGVRYLARVKHVVASADHGGHAAGGDSHGGGGHGAEVAPSGHQEG